MPARRRLRIGCEFLLDLGWPVHAVLQVEPRPDGDVGVGEPTLTVSPEAQARHYVDGFGNVCRRLDLGPGQTRIRFEAAAEVSGALDDLEPAAGQCSVSRLPDDVLQFTLASRYCQTDVLGNTAWRLFGDSEPGWKRVQAVCDWVHDHLLFLPGSSGTSTSATEVYLQREGVCRDFTHLAITFLRALNIPARYCFGYLPDLDIPAAAEPMDFAAWLEAYLGDRWYTFDPRNNVRRAGRVLIGRGRDALDVAMLTSYGSARVTALRVAAEEAAATPWSSADPPVLGSFAGAGR